MRLLIVNSRTPKPYSSKTLRREALGGTEATVVRLAEHLDAIVIQHNRTKNEGRYRAPSSSENPTHLVVMRSPTQALTAIERYPKARKFLWMHDLVGPERAQGRELIALAPRLAKAGISIVCVSDFHEAQIRRNFMSMPATRRPKVTRIYNPVDVSDRDPGPRKVDPNKLVFFSSPHKGLDYALHIFAHLHKADRRLRLYVANPGYSERTERAQPGVVNLGSVPHHVIMGHVQTALCTFCPNYVYPETFGLVLAESNALGTPVITHPIGAAPEVIRGADQFLPIPKIRSVFEPAFFRWPALSQFVDPALARLGCFAAYAQRVQAWQQGRRPVVTARPEFSLAAVGEAWKKLLKGD